MKTYIMGRTGLIGSALARHCDLTDDPKDADYLIFAAGYGQPEKFMADPLGTIAVNTTGLLSLIDAMRPGARLLYLSSSEIYSGNSRLKYSEDQIGRTSLYHQRACYIEAKRCGEVICNAARAQGKSTVIARVSMVYGPGFKPGDTRVLNQFVEMAVNDQKIVLRDTGTARRCYLYIDDCVRMLLNILKSGTHPVYNVGARSEVSIATLAEKIAALTKSTYHFTQHDLAALEGAPRRVRLDLSRYFGEFHEDATGLVPLEDGLRRTIDWYRGQQRREAAA